MRYFIKFSYDGSCFNGFQRQLGLKTVQGRIEEVLSKLSLDEVFIHASGRTDKGVHARCQCAHFDLDKDIKLYNLKKYLNNSLDGEIHVFDISLVSDLFHARYDVASKVYSYYINLGEYNPMMRNYVYQYGKNLDISLMKSASLCLIGKHDFRSFCSDSKEKENCIREIYDIDFELSGDILKITFKGDGFLRKMIRNIVALLIQVGSCEVDSLFVLEVLNKKNRDGNLKCAPSCGLYLEEVLYKNL